MAEHITEVTFEVILKLQPGSYAAVLDEDKLEAAIVNQLEMHPQFYDVQVNEFTITETEEDEEEDDEDDEEDEE